MPQIQSKSGELSLYYRISEATGQQGESRDDAQRPAALLLHGYGDHCHRYINFVDWLNQLGISVLHFDFRGHGRSEGKRGHVYAFQDYLDDVIVMIDLFERELKPTRRLLLGHSNGGLVAAHALATLPALNSWDAAVLSSPFFAIKVPVPYWKRALAMNLSRFMPTLQLPTELHADLMSHDPEVAKAYETDPLIGRVATARWFTETLQAHQALSAKMKEIAIPTLWQVAGDDHIVDPAVTLELFKAVTQAKELHLYDDCYHEIWFEDDERRAPIMSDLAQFLEAHAFTAVNGEGETSDEASSTEEETS